MTQYEVFGFVISVIIPTFEAERDLAATLTALIDASIEGLLREVIIVDGGSTDATLQIADDAGASVLTTKKGRGHQLACGARKARGDWLLFLHADTILQPDWAVEAAAHIARMQRRGTQGAAAFRFALHAEGLWPRIVEFGVGLRSNLAKLPYGDQGLLISRPFYDQLGGFAEMPLMEDVDMVRRIGRARLTLLPAKAVTSARRYEELGYVRRMARNLFCLGQYFAGVAPEKIVQRYERGDGNHG